MDRSTRLLYTIQNTSVDTLVCNCALNTKENGIEPELINIFLYFRDAYNKPTFPEKTKNRPMPILNNSEAWKVWKKEIQGSMMNDEDIRKFAFYMFCALA